MRKFLQRIYLPRKWPNHDVFIFPVYDLLFIFFFLSSLSGIASPATYLPGTCKNWLFFKVEGKAKCTGRWWEWQLTEDKDQEKMRKKFYLALALICKSSDSLECSLWQWWGNVWNRVPVREAESSEAGGQTCNGAALWSMACSLLNVS